MQRIILIIDEDMGFLAQAGMHITEAGYMPITARRAADSLRLLGNLAPSLVLWSPAADGVPPIELRELPEGVPVRIMSPQFRDWARAGGEYRPGQAASPAFADCLRLHAEIDAVPLPPGGALAERPLPELLAWMLRQRRSGVLTLRWPGGEGMPEQTWALTFARGRLAALSGHQDMALADYLAGQELIPFTRMRALFGRASQLPGGLLSALGEGGEGLPDETALRNALAGFAETLFSQPVFVREGRYELAFTAIEPAREVLPAASLALRLARRVDADKLAALLGGPEWVPRAYPLPLIPMERLPLTPHEGWFLSQIDGRRKLDELAGAGVLGKTDAWRAFYLCLLTRLVSGYADGRDIVYGSGPEFGRDKQAHMAHIRECVRHIEETAERMGSENPWTILGLPQRADAATVQVRYDALRVEFAPERFPEEIRARHRTKLTLINAKISDAYLTLLQAPPSAGGAPGAGDADFRAIEATRLRQQAQRQHLSGEREHAINLLNMSLQYDDLAADTHFLLATVLKDHPLPKRRMEAEANFKRALELAPDNPDYAAGLALACEERQPHLARRLVEQHLKKHPKHAQLNELSGRLAKFLTE